MTIHDTMYKNLNYQCNPSTWFYRWPFYLLVREFPSNNNMFELEQDQQPYFLL